MGTDAKDNTNNVPEVSAEVPEAVTKQDTVVEKITVQVTEEQIEPETTIEKEPETEITTRNKIMASVPVELEEEVDFSEASPAASKDASKESSDSLDRKFGDISKIDELSKSSKDDSASVKAGSVDDDDEDEPKKDEAAEAANSKTGNDDDDDDDEFRDAKEDVDYESANEEEEEKKGIDVDRALDDVIKEDEEKKKSRKGSGKGGKGNDRKGGKGNEKGKGGKGFEKGKGKGWFDFGKGKGKGFPPMPGMPPPDFFHGKGGAPMGPPPPGWYGPPPGFGPPLPAGAPPGTNGARPHFFPEHQHYHHHAHAHHHHAHAHHHHAHHPSYAPYGPPPTTDPAKEGEAKDGRKRSRSRRRRDHRDRSRGRDRHRDRERERERRGGAGADRDRDARGHRRHRDGDSRDERDRKRRRHGSRSRDRERERRQKEDEAKRAGGAATGFPPPTQALPPLPKEATEMIALRKVPKDLNKIEHMEGNFRRFGRVLTASCDPKKGNAVVEFDNAMGAHRAHFYGPAFGVKEIEICFCRGDPVSILKKMRTGAVPEPEPKKKPSDDTPQKLAKKNADSSPKHTPGNEPSKTRTWEKEVPKHKLVMNQKQQMLATYTQQLQSFLAKLRNPHLTYDNF
eukprot:gene981-1157_t